MDRFCLLGVYQIIQLEQLVARKADSMASLYKNFFVVIYLLAFAAFLRFDELANLLRSDVKIDNEVIYSIK